VDALLQDAFGAAAADLQFSRRSAGIVGSGRSVPTAGAAYRRSCDRWIGHEVEGKP
jgi:hypothetical protein